MELKLISRNEAEALYCAGETVYIGVFSKEEGGAWWKIDAFDEDIPYTPNLHKRFKALAHYFHTSYCPDCRTRYAVKEE